jgi:hypothetical protein
MTRVARHLRSALTSIAAVAAMALGLHAADPPNFKPDGKLETLTGTEVIGQAEWRAEKGEIVGRAKPGGSGWLVIDKALQNLLFYTNVTCQGACQTGVLLRAEKTPDGGMRGVYVSLTDGDFNSYRVTLDAQGRETSRTQIVTEGRRGGGGGGGGGGAQGRGGPPQALQPAGNPLQITLWNNQLSRSVGTGGPLTDPATAQYGRIALFVGGTGEVRYKDVAWKDINRVVEEPEKVSDRFTMRHISSMYYGWSAAASDINKDGALDIVSGPFYYLGPTYLERRVYREGRQYNPSTEYSPDMVNFTYDFTGDGWPDILSSEMVNGRPLDLHVNPKGESRLWDRHRVLPTVSTEVVLMRDIDDDGKIEMIFGGGGVYSWARPDPANPTAVWTSNHISTKGQTVTGHGIGLGDVNGDGRKDLVVPTGWYEQPAQGIAGSPWTFHEVAFFEGMSVFGLGGGEIGVYDMNGDGLSDVIAGSAHSWGLYWWEQKRAADGARTFVRHTIADSFASKNMGGVTFSEGHASRIADMNGDKIPDFITGKRYWSHLENYGGPDPYGPAVIYVYRTVRNKSAPGGAEFVPELVHNRSGVGSTFEVTDLNKDGRPDIAVAGAYGTHVFLSK